MNVVREFSLTGDSLRDLDKSATNSEAQEGQHAELLDLVQKACGSKDLSIEDDSGLDEIPTRFNLKDEKW